MKNKIKILTNIITALVLFVLCLPIYLSLLLNINFVQNIVVRKLSKVATEALGSPVSIERVDISLFYRASITGFYVEDPIENDTLFYVQNLRARLKNFNFTSGINLEYAYVDSGKMFLNGDSTGTLNLKLITDKLKPKTPRVKKKDFKLNIDKILISGFNFEYRTYNPEPVAHGINYKDMRFNDINISARKFQLITDSINMKVDSLFFSEKSGFDILNISTGNLRLSSSEITLDDADLLFEHSSVAIESYSMKYKDWYMGDFLNKVELSAIIKNADIDFRDIAKFTPQPQPWISKLNFNGEINGTISKLRGTIKDLQTHKTHLDEAKFIMTGLPDIKKCHFEFEITKFNSSVSDMRSIIYDFTGKDMKLFNQLSMLSMIGFTGKFDGYFSDFNSSGQLSTGFGNVNYKFSNTPNKYGMTLRGEVFTKGIDLGGMFKIKKLGKISLTGKMNALIANDSLNLTTKTNISSLEYNNYLYSNINIDGDIINKTFYGYVGCDDKNLDFDFNGSLMFGSDEPVYDFKLIAEKADLYALNFSKKDTVSQVSCVVNAVGSGFKLDNINGKIIVDSLKYMNSIDTVSTGEIVFTTRNSDNSKLMKLESDFADIELQGQQSYSNIFRYLANTVQKYLPSMQKVGNNVKSVATSRNKLAQEDNADAAKNGYYIATMNVKKANNVSAIFMPGLEMAEGTSLYFLFNPALNEFSFNFNSKYIRQRNTIISDISIDSRSSQDSISLYARSGEMLFNNIYIPDFLLIGGVKDDKVNIDAKFINNIDGSEAFVSTRSVFERDKESGMLRLKVSLLPSHFSLGGEGGWSINYTTITLDTTKISISPFSLTSKNQRLSLWGDISANRNDSLSISLSNFNLAPFSVFTDKLGYDIKGTLDGNMSVVSVLKDPYVISNLNFNNFALNDKTFEKSTFTSGWSEAKRSIIFSLSQAGTPNLIDGAYRLKEKLFYADIDISNVDLSVISPFMKGISSNTSGSGDIKVRLTNPGKKLKINGKVDIHNLETKIDFTQVKYNVSGHVDIVDNHFKLSDAIIEDELGSQCSMEAEVFGKNFKKVDYSINAYPSKMLCMNTTISDNETFYGRMFGTGSISVVGHGTDVVMNVNATSDANSTFYMPLSGKSTMKQVDFIKFVSPDTMISSEHIKKNLIVVNTKNLTKNVGSFAINLNLNIKPNIEAQIVIDPTVGDIIKGRGLGDLRIYVNPALGDLTINGGVEIIEGSYLFTLSNIINKYFKIQPGSTINWSGNPLDAKLNITATYLVKTSLAPLLGNDPQYSKRAEVDCDLMLTGRLLRPDIKLGISLPSVDPEVQGLVNSVLNTEENISTQIFWLLFANTFYADANITSSGMNNNFTAGAAVTGLEFLSNQISNWISTDKFNLGFSYRPKGDMTSDELELRFSAPLLKDKLLLDAEANYNFKNNQAYITENVKSFSTDISLTWLINQASNLDAKAFTRQINTFDENQGLQETGVGIYYTDNFNRFKDLIFKYRQDKIERGKEEVQKKELIDSIGKDAYKVMMRKERQKTNKMTQ